MQKGDQGTIPGHLFVFLANRMSRNGIRLLLM